MKPTLFDLSEIPVSQKESAKKKSGVREFRFDWIDSDGTERKDYSLNAKNLEDLKKRFKTSYFRSTIKTVYQNGKMIYHNENAAKWQPGQSR